MLSVTTLLSLGVLILALIALIVCVVVFVSRRKNNPQSSCTGLVWGIVVSLVFIVVMIAFLIVSLLLGVSSPETEQSELSATPTPAQTEAVEEPVREDTAVVVVTPEPVETTPTPSPSPTPTPEPEPEPATTPIPYGTYLTVWGDVTNLRAEPSEKSDKVDTLYAGDKLDFLSVVEEDLYDSDYHWFEVRYGNYVCYVSMGLVTVPCTDTVTVGDEAVVGYERPSENFDSLCTIPAGTEVSRTGHTTNGEDWGWSLVTFNGVSAYIPDSALSAD